MAKWGVLCDASCKSEQELYCVHGPELGLSTDQARFAISNVAESVGHRNDTGAR